MKKLFPVIATVILLMTAAGCGVSTEKEAEASNEEPINSQVSAAAPASQAMPSKPEESVGSTPASAPSEPDAERTDNENPVTQTVPAIHASGFYDANEGGANLSVLCTGVGRYWLSYENSKSLLAYLDFSKLTPTDQTNTMEIDSAEPGIVFTAPDFSCELRLDQMTNIAVYEIGGSTRYYYTMPEGFYETAYEWASTYAQYNYNEYHGDYGEEAENVTTGQNPESEETQAESE